MPAARAWPTNWARRMTRAADVSDEASVMAAFDDIETRHGPISVLVSAAGLLFQDNGERPLIRTPRWISGNAASP